jgi:hypothetical protein
MSRWKAAAIHSSISAVIALLIGALFFGLWYPPPYFHAAGADELVMLLVGVDLGIGPLLTLIVFRSGKRGLRFDLSVIAVLQTAALIYGLFVVLQSRPVFLVAAVDRLVLISGNEITDDDLKQGAEPEFRSRSWTGPRIVAAVMPTDPKERSDVVFAAAYGRDLEKLPKYYHPYATTAKALLTQARSLDGLRRKSADADAKVASWLARSGRTESSVVWVPLQARKEDIVMLLDAETAQPLQALAIDPW